MYLLLLLFLYVVATLSNAQLISITPRIETVTASSGSRNTILPENCSRIYNEGSANPYNKTSVAAAFQVFCSVRQRISQCIADNQQRMLRGDDPLQWSTGLLFNKRVFDQDSATLCNSLSAVAEDLQCFASRTVGSADCSSTFYQAVPPIFQGFRNGTIDTNLARKTICRISNATSNCITNLVNNCSKGAQQFSRNYYNIFYGTCAPGSVLEALPEYIRDSIFVTCFIDSFSEIIEDIIRDPRPPIDEIVPYINRIMQYVCRRTGALSQCLVQRSRNTTNQIDRIIFQFVNVTNIQRALNLLCQSGQDFSTASECLIDVPVQSQFCAKIYYSDLFKPRRGFPPVPTTTASPSVDDYLKQFCPPMKQVVDCSYLPLSRCSRNLTNTMNSIVNILMTDRCRRYADMNTVRPWDRNIFASTLNKCGYVITTQIGKAAVGIGGNATIGNTVESIKQGMAIACRNANWFVTCVDDRILSSRNVVDRSAREILDFSSGVDRHKIVRDVCQNLTEIQSSIPCILNLGRTSTSIYGCFRNDTVWSTLSNITELENLNGDMIRTRFCKPIERLTTCARNFFGPCSSSLNSLMESVPKAMLRTDCGGIRASTTTVGAGRNIANHVKQDVVFVGLVVVMAVFMNKI